MDDDAIPPTLEPILALIFRDWTPELKASAECFNHWVNDSDRHIPSGHLVSLDGKRRVHPTLGPIEYALRGVTIRRPCAPQMLWHFDKASAEMRHSDAVALDRLTALMRRVGGIEAMRLQLARPIVRQDYVLTVG